MTYPKITRYENSVRINKHNCKKSNHTRKAHLPRREFKHVHAKQDERKSFTIEFPFFYHNYSEFL